MRQKQTAAKLQVSGILAVSLIIMTGCFIPSLLLADTDVGVEWINKYPVCGFKPLSGPG